MAKVNKPFEMKRAYRIITGADALLRITTAHPGHWTCMNQESQTKKTRLHTHASKQITKLTSGGGASVLPFAPVCSGSSMFILHAGQGVGPLNVVVWAHVTGFAATVFSVSFVESLPGVPFSSSLVSSVFFFLSRKSSLAIVALKCFTVLDCHLPSNLESRSQKKSITITVVGRYVGSRHDARRYEKAYERPTAI
jgi:hypothetical protein